MPLDSRDAASIWDMVQSIQRIQSFIGAMSFDEYLQDVRTISAVERQFEILGEAARRVSDELRQARPSIDWQRIIGLRNIVAHRYDAVRQDILWDIVQSELAPLSVQLRALLPPPPE